MASQIDKLKKSGKNKVKAAASRQTGIKVSSSYNFGQEIQSIHIDLLVPNEKNLRDAEGDPQSLQTLMDNIYELGLQQNLVVYRFKQDDIDKFKILSGHRRYTAIKKLHALYPDDERFRLIPCLVENLNEDPEHGISFDLAEKMYIASTNVEVKSLSRRKLLANIAVCLEYYTKKYGNAPEGRKEAINQTLSSLSISKRQLETLLQIENRLIEDIRTLFTEEKLSFKTARLLIQLRDDEQEAIYKAYGEDLNTLTQEAIDAFFNHQNSKEAIEDDLLKTSSANGKEKEVTQGKTSKTAEEYKALPEDFYAPLPDRYNAGSISCNAEGRRVFDSPKTSRKRQLDANLQKDLAIIMPRKMMDENTTVKLGKTDYREYVKAMNAISKQLFKIAEILK